MAPLLSSVDYYDADLGTFQEGDMFSVVFHDEFLAVSWKKLARESILWVCDVLVVSVVPLNRAGPGGEACSPGRTAGPAPQTSGPSRRPNKDNFL
jgi:hypothetical protein